MGKQSSGQFGFGTMPNPRTGNMPGVNLLPMTPTFEPGLQARSPEQFSPMIPEEISEYQPAQMPAAQPDIQMAPAFDGSNRYIPRYTGQPTPSVGYGQPYPAPQMMPPQYPMQGPAMMPPYPQPGMIPGVDPNQSMTSDPMMQQAMRGYFMGSMGAARRGMNMQSQALQAEGRRNSVSNFFDNGVGQIAGGLMAAGRPGSGGLAMADSMRQNFAKGNQAYVGNMNSYINQGQQGARDAIAMMTATDPNNFKNQMALMNAQTNAYRAQAYGNQVYGQNMIGAGRMDLDSQKAADARAQFSTIAMQKNQELQQNLLRIQQEGQRLELSAQEIGQRMQIAQMQNQTQLQQIGASIYNATMGAQTSIYNNQNTNYNTDMSRAGQMMNTPDGPMPMYSNAYRQQFGMGDPAPPPPGPNPMDAVMSWFGGQPANAQPPQPVPVQPQALPQRSAPTPPMQSPAPQRTAPPPAAIAMYKQAAPAQKAGLRQAFIQKYGVDPGQ